MTIMGISKKMQVIVNLIYFTHFTEQPSRKTSFVAELPLMANWWLKISKLGERYPQN